MRTQTGRPAEAAVRNRKVGFWQLAHCVLEKQRLVSWSEVLEGHWKCTWKGHEEIMKSAIQAGKVAVEGGRAKVFSLHVLLWTLCPCSLPSIPTDTHPCSSDPPRAQALCLWIPCVALSWVSQQTPPMSLLLTQGIKVTEVERRYIYIAYAMATLIKRDIYTLDWPTRTFLSTHKEGCKKQPRSKECSLKSPDRLWPWLPAQGTTLSFSLPISGLFSQVPLTARRRWGMVGFDRMNNFWVMFLLSDAIKVSLRGNITTTD